MVRLKVWSSLKWPRPIGRKSRKGVTACISNLCAAKACYRHAACDVRPFCGQFAAIAVRELLGWAGAAAAGLS